MRNKLYFLINFKKQQAKESFLFFSGGFFLSAAFTLYSNEFFYRNVIRGKKGLQGAIDEIAPKELLGKGAKKTFIDHQLETKEVSDIYKEYVDRKNKENSLELPQSSENEFKVLMNRQKEKEIIEEYKKNIFDKK